MKYNAPYIYFVPVGGLGNRMRSIASAMCLADENQADMQIGWYQDWGMGCRFSDIFKPLKYEMLEESGIRKYLLDRPRKKNLFVPAIYEHLAFDKVLTEFEVGYKDIDFASYFQSPACKRIWMASCKAFYKEEDVCYSMFKPTDLLQTQIDEVVNTFPKSIVGMQIRRTDHVTAIQSSPTRCFEEVIERLDKDTKIYLATDDEREKNYFLQKYGSRIITRTSVLERGSVRGIQDAVVEMYILGSTQKIYGSKSSSFGQIAAKLGNIDFIEVENK